MISIFLGIVAVGSSPDLVWHLDLIRLEMPTPLFFAVGKITADSVLVELPGLPEIAPPKDVADFLHVKPC